jgi:hypothetical protein
MEFYFADIEVLMSGWNTLYQDGLEWTIRVPSDSSLAALMTTARDGISGDRSFNPWRFGGPQ